MFGLKKLAQAVFGTTNDRKVTTYAKRVPAINALEPEYAKLSDEAVRHMDQQINEWCERNPDVEIKFSTSTVGIWTGKHAEPNLIVTVFY